MRISGVPSAWALGDCALVMNAYDGKPCPPTGQFAERQGRQAAQNLARVLAGEPTRPFYFKPLGQLCSIGGHRAVADLFGHHIAGFWAWFIWRGVYLLELPSWPRRFRVGFDWAWQLMFARDLSGLRPDFTDRVSRAHYQPGEFVFHQGDPATNFYVIDRGEVEVVRTNPDTGADEVLALLGAGSFFGELALFSNRPRNAGIRARSAVDVIVMGREVFTQISQSLAPLREILSQTINRRTTDLWHQRTAAYEILKEVPLTDFVEPVPFPLLRPEDTFAHAVELFDQKAYEFCYVSPDGQTLAGVVTRTDLFRALSSGAKPETFVDEFMTKDPVAICLADTSLAAAATMRDHHLKWIPVVNAKEDRHLVGCLRAHAMLARVTKEISNQPAPSG